MFDTATDDCCGCGCGGGGGGGGGGGALGRFSRSIVLSELLQ